MTLDIQLDDGKYRVTMDDEGAMIFYRGGQLWPAGQQAFEHAKIISSMVWRISDLEKQVAALSVRVKPVAYAVQCRHGGIHKLAITKETADKKAAHFTKEWPNNPCRVRPLIFAEK